MGEKPSFNLRSFKLKAAKRKRGMRLFLSKLRNTPPRGLDAIATEIDKQVWKEVDCLSCANCCRSMTPTFTPKDIKRIASHFKMSESDFKEKWLYKDRSGDWMNTKSPCQFLDLKTNKCSIYSIRPDDCAGFPHLTKRKMTEYMHVHKQNVAYCPATFNMTEKLQAMFSKVSHQKG